MARRSRASCRLTCFLTREGSGHMRGRGCRGHQEGASYCLADMETKTQGHTPQDARGRGGVWGSRAC